MQFINDGPDIPEHLLQAHDEGRVVFFCGAGISAPAGLPDFEELVVRLFSNLHQQPDRMQQAAIDEERFDQAIGLLEKQILGDREHARIEVANILRPNLDTERSTKLATHTALLRLSRYKDRGPRLVTTNFDRLFEEAIADLTMNVERFRAPLLPVPKKRWQSLVYLHGLLSQKPTARELNQLVLSSGDFGLAYLSERWAARFVSELLRNYIVCFVGYSMGDVVLRYLMDAPGRGSTTWRVTA